MSTDVNDALGISQPSSSPQNTVQPDKYSSLKNIAGAISVFAWILGAVIFIIGIIAGANIGARYGGGIIRSIRSDNTALYSYGSIYCYYTPGPGGGYKSAD